MIEWLVIGGIGSVVVGGIVVGLRASRSIALQGELVWNQTILPHLEALQREDFDTALSYTNDAFNKSFSRDELVRNFEERKAEWGALRGWSHFRTRKQGNLFTGESELVMVVDLVFERHTPRIQIFVDAKIQPYRISFSGRLVLTQTLRREPW